MASVLSQFTTLILFALVRFSHSDDPQPEQIHLSSTGKKVEGGRGTVGHCGFPYISRLRIKEHLDVLVIHEFLEIVMD